MKAAQGLWWSMLAVCLGMTTQWATAQDAQRRAAQTLSAQVNEFYRSGNYQQAIPLAQRALALNEESLGTEHRDVARSLSELASLYNATGAYGQAQPLYQRALTIVEKEFGPEHPVTATALNNLGFTLYSMSRYTQAEPLYERALAIRDKVTPEDPDLALSLGNLAALFRATGRYSQAEPLLRRILQIAEALGLEHPDTATALSSLGTLYQTMGAYARAEPLYQRALEINRKVLGWEHRDTATTLNNLASLHSVNGDYARAELEYQQALAITERVLGREHPDTAGSLNNLAFLYQRRGEYAQAEPLYVRALAIREKVLGPDHPETSISLGNLASLYLATGAYARAEPLQRRALAIAEKVLGAEHPTTAAAVNSLAGLYGTIGKHEQAEPLYQRALAIREKVLGAEHRDVANSLNNLAQLYRATGAYQRAEPLYQRALAIVEKALGADHPDVALALNNLAFLYYSGGAYARAEPLYHRALAIRQKILGQEHPDTVASLNNLAALYEAGKMYDDSEGLFELAQDLGERNTVRFLVSGSEARKQAYLKRRRSEADGYISASLAHLSPRSIALGLTSVLQHKGRVLDAQSSSIVRLRLAAKPEDRLLFDELSAAAEELSELSFRGAGKLSANAYLTRLDALRTQQDALQSQLASRSAALGQVLAPVTLAGVRSALPADAVLIEWFRYRPFDARAKPGQQFGAPRYAAYVLKRGGEPQAIDLGEAKPIEGLIARFRSALVDPATDSRSHTVVEEGPPQSNVQQLAAQLSEKLIKPLRPYISAKERLLVSPDGALNLVPFAALLDERGDYLAKRFEISYLTSGRDLLRIANDAPARSGDVVLANPNYGQRRVSAPLAAASSQTARSADLDRGGLTWDPLPGTAMEAKKLQSLLQLDATRVITGDNATEAKLRSLHGPRILHLATHGFFLEDKEAEGLLNRRPELGSDGLAPVLGESPLLRSGLVLAGANVRSSAGGDGIFTAGEAAELDLVGTQLVVLSACETALGTVNAGEGVYGLRRALVLAGAQSQLSSLWKVNDAATQALMVEYYQRLLQGEGRAAALRSVQKTMLADPARQHPYYWAAFIPIGDWRALRR